MTCRTEALVLRKEVLLQRQIQFSQENMEMLNINVEDLKKSELTRRVRAAGIQDSLGAIHQRLSAAKEAIVAVNRKV